MSVISVGGITEAVNHALGQRLAYLRCVVGQRITSYKVTALVRLTSKGWERAGKGMITSKTHVTGNDRMTAACMVGKNDLRPGRYYLAIPWAILVEARSNCRMGCPAAPCPADGPGCALP